MARKVLFINGHDYSGFVAEDGYQWEDNDIDGDGAGRAMDTMMDRQDKAANLLPGSSAIGILSHPHGHQAGIL